MPDAPYGVEVVSPVLYGQIPGQRPPHQPSPTYTHTRRRIPTPGTPAKRL